MTTIPLIVREAEAVVHQLAGDLTAVRERECLCCYVARQLDAFGCDGTHRHAMRYRDDAAPRVKALANRLRRLGACCCDCELLLNGFELHARFWTPEREMIDTYGVTVIFDAEPPFALPPCTGVRGSFVPCANWVRIARHT